ncbi:MAG TPA: 2-oxoacid:acceptor oxidoreductase family protein [Candidatus Hydrogenedentes bacterium]|jgi:indolepyruvate ferredoxin oxidoreductase beta subunit|nr:2-oxoacid:acceptor oxidoreductase family protein [Candidatus Hydrogenedentota bacterium]HQN01926.1 2-oxoacid:acceptor oxidoreductase family protein [Candidatus Hydrogenedentota bacterium]
MNKTSSITNVVIAGLGGQGVIRAANILAETAFRSGLDVKQGEIHGMSQRGGSVTSDVRFGQKVYSPMVPTGEADYVLVLHPSQVDNNRYHKKEGGYFFSVFDLKDGLVQLIDLDNDASTPVTERNCNIALLGMLSIHLPFEDTVWETAIKNNLPKKVHDENLAVFHYGKSIVPKG